VRRRLAPSRAGLPARGLGLRFAGQPSPFRGSDVQQLTRRLEFVSLHGLGRLQAAEPRQPGPGHHPAHSGLRDTHAAGDTQQDDQTVAELHDQQRLGRIDRARRASRARLRVAKGSLTTGQIATKPLTHGRGRHPICPGGFTDAEPLQGHQLDHLESTGIRVSGILLGVHPAVFSGSRVFCDFQPLNPARINTGYNLCKLPN